MSEYDKKLTRADEFLAGRVIGLSGGEYPYWINPASSEIEKAAKFLNDNAVRFVADRKEKKIYVWPADGDIHWYFGQEVIKGYKPDPINYLEGVSEKEGGVWKMTNSVQILNIAEKGKPYNIDWTWIEKKSDIKGIKEFFKYAFEDKEFSKPTFEFMAGKFTGLMGEDVPYWVNPSYSELEAASKLDPLKAVRFSADGKNKRVYMWPSDAALHPIFGKQVIKGYDPFDTFADFFDGVAQKRGGKWIVTDSDQFMSILRSGVDFDPDWYKIDWMFIERKSDIQGVKKFLQKLPKYRGESRAVNLLTQLDEKFRFGLQGQFDYTNVYENPKFQELQELGDEVRFIVNFSGEKVYVWKSEAELHYKLARRLRTSMDPTVDLWGIAAREGKKWWVVGSDYTVFMLTPEKIDHFLAQNLSWAEKYIHGLKDFLERVKKRKEEGKRKMIARAKQAQQKQKKKFIPAEIHVM